MSARIFTAATLVAAFCCAADAAAADSQLLSLVMPDAKVLAGVNVDQAKATPFGQTVLAQMQSNSEGLRKLIALTGFDPTQDVHEVLAVTNTPGKTQSHTGMVLARGNFDPGRIQTAATAAGAVIETYGGATILEDPQQAHGLVFLDPTLVIAGDIANVKGAIDRHSGQTLPAAVVSAVNQWSGSEDAWVMTTVPPSTVNPPAGAPRLPGFGPNAQGVFQQIQQAGAGVKFGDTVAATIQLTADNAQNATQISSALQLLVNMAQMQANQNNPPLSVLAQGLSITTQGAVVKLTAAMPQAVFQQLMQAHHAAAARPAK